VTSKPLDKSDSNEGYSVQSCAGGYSKAVDRGRYYGCDKTILHSHSCERCGDVWMCQYDDCNIPPVTDCEMCDMLHNELEEDNDLP
jgi:hypothetical protein